MGKREWLSKVFKVLASLAAICKSNSGAVQATTLGPDAFFAPPHTASAPHSCTAPPRHSDQFLLIISTLDGALSVLDMHKQGILLWSVQVDERPLLSSSISKMEVTRDGMPTRLIPSLDGGMFQYDGETIEELPMTAESLLSSSVRVTENSVMVGGKEIQSYGVDLNTGKILYSCSTEGCNRVRKNEVNAAGQDLLVITRNTQTVRAVDIHSGSEKWNFSVGQHELLFVGGVQKEKPQIDVDGSESDITIATCESSEEELKFEEEEQMKRYLKFMVPDGKVIGLNPNDPSHISWQHKFPSPVAKVWMLHQGHLEVMSLFDSKHIPALSSFQHPDPSSSDPLLYVGKHQNQLYVQPSDVYEMGLSERLQLYQRPQKREEPGSMVHLPRVTWKPYLNTGRVHFVAGFRTPTLGGNQPPDTPLLDYTNGFDLTEEDAEHGTSLTIWSEHYPFDNGFYLYPNYHDAKECLDPNWQLGVKPEEESLINMASFWIWWKEVVVISLLTSVFVHIILTRCVHHPLKSATAEEKTSSGSLVSEDSKPTLAVVQPPADYQSRFATDFECLECLGKGGFGIVFKAKNKVDDQQYAVKRISLPKSEGAKDKVLREVKALAKLEHVGIVRFFHAWVESPPPGWQEEKDKELNTGSSSCFTPTLDRSMVPTGTAAIPSSSWTIVQAPIALKKCAQQASAFTDMSSFGVGDSDFSVTFQKSGSGEFSVHSNAESFTDESGSFSISTEDHPNFNLKEKRDSFPHLSKWNGKDGGASNGALTASKGYLPFSRYKEIKDNLGCCAQSVSGELTSSSIEDSGCRGEDHTELTEDSESVIFADSRSGVNLSSDVKEATRKSNPVDFSLSSKTSSEPVPLNSCSLPASSKSHVPLPRLFLYIQMQLCQQETLKDWLMSNTLNRDRGIVLNIFDQIVCAVDYVHRSGLIHRDLKPSNIFFAMDGTVKVGDFGLVTALAENVEENNPSSTFTTSTKHTADVGTQLYMSPEQVQKKSYDQMVDVFSLGVILLELLMPFSTGMERITTLQNARKGKFPERFCRELPVESTLVQSLMSDDPKLRPTTQKILEHNILRDFSSRRTNVRSRTISSGSSDPNSPV